VAILLSNSGETEEVLQAAQGLRRAGASTIALTAHRYCCSASSLLVLASVLTLVLDCGGACFGTGVSVLVRASMPPCFSALRRVSLRFVSLRRHALWGCGSRACVCA